VGVAQGREAPGVADLERDRVCDELPYARHPHQALHVGPGEEPAAQLGLDTPELLAQQRALLGAAEVGHNRVQGVVTSARR
jgi:hypothetical protein